MKGIRYLFRHLNPTDRIVLLYLCLTTVWILAFFGQVSHPLAHLGFRLAVIVLAGLVLWLHRSFPHPIVSFLHAMYPLLLLVFLYGETDSLNEVMGENRDAWFAALEERIFGLQPSIVFSQRMPQPWFNHLMFFSYFSYFLLIMAVLFYQYHFTPDRFPRSIFLVISSFFLFYLVFILLPVAGPQYYFQGVNGEAAGDHLFGRIVKLIQSVGERPTGAFPSSHIGLTVISMFLLWQTSRRGFVAVLPFAFLLVLSTVYIKAHYVIDVIAGILYAPVACSLSSCFYTWFSTGADHAQNERKGRS